jgi:pseudouridine kinase
MVVTMGGAGSVYADWEGNSGMCPARKVQVKDTTGAGDAFCAGVSIGLTYGKTLSESVEIGTLLAASVITSKENVCPRFMPEELGLDVHF